MTTVTTREAQFAAHLDLDGRQVVDVGCGRGALVRWLRSQGADVVGLECNAVQRDAAVAADPEHADRYLDAVGEAMPLPDDSADIVIFAYSLHHVPEEAMRQALDEAHRVLTDDGTLVVLEPIAAGPGHEVDRLIDDETRVRDLAQRALAGASRDGLFEEVERTTFETVDTYADFAAYETVMVGVDPDRAARLELVRSQAVRSFHELAEPVDDGWVFHQPNDLAVLRKRPSR